VHLGFGDLPEDPSAVWAVIRSAFNHCPKNEVKVFVYLNVGSNPANKICN